MEAESEDKVTIDQLPEEILLTILKYLEKDDLKEASLVAPNWNKIISSNSSTMKLLPLYLCNPSEDETLEMLSSSRRFAELVLSGEFAVNMDRIVEKHGQSVTKLVFNNILFTDEQAKNFFIALANVEKLVFENYDANPDPMARQTVKMDKVKEIVSSSYNPHMIKLFDTPNLIILKYNNEFSDVVPQSQQFMEILAIRNAHVQALTVNVEAVKKMSLCLVSVDGLEEIFVKFKDSLEELELTTMFEYSLFESIFKNLFKLKVLKIDPEDAPKDLIAYQNFRPNRSICTAIFESNYYKGQSVEGFAANMPNLKTLVLNIKKSPVPNDLMKFIAVNLLKLEKLEVSRVENESFADLKLSSLRELHIYATHELTHDGWKKITENCINIEKLTVGSVHDLFALHEPELETIGTNLKKLKHLTIGCGFLGSKKIFDDIMRNCPTLESFTIIENSIKDDPTMIENFTKNGPKLFVRSLSYKTKRVDFDLWEGEGEDYPDDESYFTNNGFDEMDIDENVDEDFENNDDFEIGGGWVDGNNHSDDEFDNDFQGEARPG